MQNVLYLPQQLLPPPVMLLLQDISFSILIWTALALVVAPADQMGREIVKFFYMREGKMVTRALFVL